MTDLEFGALPLDVRNILPPESQRILPSLDTLKVTNTTITASEEGKMQLRPYKYGYLPDLHTCCREAG